MSLRKTANFGNMVFFVLVSQGNWIFKIVFFGCKYGKMGSGGKIKGYFFDFRGFGNFFYLRFQKASFMSLNCLTATSTGRSKTYMESRSMARNASSKPVITS